MYLIDTNIFLEYILRHRMSGKSLIFFTGPILHCST
jgi:predicted nucleic acid-binding protein